MLIKFLLFVIPPMNLLAFTATEASTPHISVDPPTKDSNALIRIVGDIKQGDDEEFRQIAAKYADAVVVLNSDGGEIKPAIDIGKTIKLREYITVVMEGEVCTSACALIWVAGSRRIIVGKGQVGFHASYRDVNGALIESGVGNAMVGYYLSQLGMGQKVAIFATTAPPDKILWLNSETAASSGIQFEAMPLPEASNETVTKKDLPNAQERAETAGGSNTTSKEQSTDSTETFDERFCLSYKKEAASIQSELPIKSDKLVSITGVSVICGLKATMINYLLEYKVPGNFAGWREIQQKNFNETICNDTERLSAYRRGWRFRQRMTFKSGEFVSIDAVCK